MNGSRLKKTRIERKVQNMTRELLDKLPQNVRGNVERVRKTMKNLPYKRDEISERAAGYAAGLRDAGLITERERQLLFIYMTL